MRTRILPHMINAEVDRYFNRGGETIIVPVGTVELHGGFPLNSETVISEAFALKMAERCDGLILTGLPYFYAGATAMARGTVQVSVREGIEYLGAIARSLLRQGFRRQIYISFHGPAHMTCSPMVRDFFDETGVPILYMDLSLQMFSSGKDIFKSLNDFHAITLGAYKLMGRLNDVPLATEFEHKEPQTVAKFNELFGLAYQSGSIGYYFGDQKDHMSTMAIATEEQREHFAERGIECIEAIVDQMNMEKVTSDLAELETFERDVIEKMPWTPAAWNLSQSR